MIGKIHFPSPQSDPVNHVFGPKLYSIGLIQNQMCKRMKPESFLYANLFLDHGMGFVKQFLDIARNFTYLSNQLRYAFVHTVSSCFSPRQKGGSGQPGDLVMLSP
jgi:hypothetical protein